MTLTKVLTSLLFFSFYIASAQDNIENLKKDSLDVEKYATRAYDAFYDVLRGGDIQSYDTLIPAFEKLERFHKDLDAKKHIRHLLFQSRMLVMRKKMKLAQEKLDLAKITYKTSTIQVPEFEQTIAYLSSYLRLQLTRKYDYEENLATLESIKNYKAVNEDILAVMEEHVGRTCIDYNKHEKALFHFRKAHKIYQKKGYKALEATAINLMGVAFDGLEQMDSVIYYNEKSIKLNEALKTPNYSTIAASSYNLGLLYLERFGNAHKAEVYYKKAAEYDLISGGEKNPYLCEDYRALAQTHLAKNDLSKAMLYAEKAVNQGKKFLGINDSRTAQAMHILAEIYTEKGQPELALSILEKSYNIFKNVIEARKIPGGLNHRWMVMTYYGMAEAKRKEKKIQEAVSLYKKGAHISKIINRDAFLIEAYQNLAEIYEENTNFKNALYYVDSLEQFLNKKFKGATYRQFDQKLTRMKLQLHLKDTVGFKKRLEKLKQQLPSKNNDPNIWLTVLGIELKYFKVSLKQVPKEKLEELLQSVVRIRNTFSNQENRVFYNKSTQGIVEQALELSFDAFENTREDYFKEMCFKLMELNKNSALLEGLQNIRFKQIADVPEKLIHSEQKLLEQLQDIKNSIIYLKNKGDVDAKIIQGLNDKLLVLDKRYDSINNTILINYPKYTNLKNLSANEGYTSFINDHLPKNKAIIEYFLGPKFCYRIVLTKKNISLERFDNAHEIRTLVEKLRFELQQQKQWEATVKSLSGLLIPNLPDHISCLGIITDDILNFVPFEILLKDGTTLLEKYALGYAGSLQLLKEQVKLTHSNNKGWSGYAPTYTEEILPNNQREVEEISAITQGKVFLGTRATKTNFINTSNKNHLLHLALHTELDNTNPLNNRMLFTNDSLKTKENTSLSAAEIYALDLNANMVVLSSCNTGYGKIAKGEGVMNMSRAFTYAGVSSTVMSLWKVPDKETSQIMTFFYEHLKKGEPKDVALKNAKQDYLKNTDDELLKHPYYWAGFIVSGDTSAVVEKQYWLWVLSIVGFVLLLIFFRKRLFKLG